MKTNLKSQKTGSTQHFHFRSRIPKDLIGHFNGKREFNISLRSVNKKQILLILLTLKNQLQELFGEIRTGMKSLGIEEIKDILRIEVNKQIDHSKHVFYDTNKYNEFKKKESLENISSREEKLKSMLSEDLKTYKKKIDSRLESILQSMDIEVNAKISQL